jgi:hypothetical protein
MTIRDSVNRRICRVHGTIFGAVTVFVILNAASSYGVGGTLPAITVLTALAVTFLGMGYVFLVGVPCPRCGSNLLDLVMFPSLLSMPKDYRFCPYCGVDVDGHCPKGDKPTWNPYSATAAWSVTTVRDRLYRRSYAKHAIGRMGFIAIGLAAVLYYHEARMVALLVGLFGAAMMALSWVLRDAFKLQCPYCSRDLSQAFEPRSLSLSVPRLRFCPHCGTDLAMPDSHAGTRGSSN